MLLQTSFLSFFFSLFLSFSLFFFSLFLSFFLLQTYLTRLKKSSLGQNTYLLSVCNCRCDETLISSEQVPFLGPASQGRGVRWRLRIQQRDDVGHHARPLALEGGVPRGLDREIPDALRRRAQGPPLFRLRRGAEWGLPRHWYFNVLGLSPGATFLRGLYKPTGWYHFF